MVPGKSSIDAGMGGVISQPLRACTAASQLLRAQLLNMNEQSEKDQSKQGKDRAPVKEQNKTLKNTCNSLGNSE